MIHYHGTPMTPTAVAAAALACRHAMVSFEHPQQIELVAEVCQSFVLDNGIFSRWRRGDGPVPVEDYLEFVKKWEKHPGFDWCVIPDSIEGDAEENNRLIAAWPLPAAISVPVWHLHENVDRLRWLCDKWPRVALGSSGQWATPGSKSWWNRISEAMEAICDADGRPAAKLHGLRMLDPTIFSHLPLASADSTNVARNIGIDKAWRGPYQPLSISTRALVLADRIERHAAANRWLGTGGIQKNFELVG